MVASLGFVSPLQHPARISRRQILSEAALCGMGVVTSVVSTPLSAEAATMETTTATTTTTTDRNQLLEAIARRASDTEIINIIQNLQDPSQGKAVTYPNRLEGEWELIWSYGAEGFSPLLTLPKPFKPESYQYLGNPATQEVGEGRIAQGLTGGILGTNNQLWLSSGATPYEPDPSILEIQPPFRLQLGGRYGSNKSKITLVEAGSDEDFRKVNARSRDAQLAGKNLYKQLYLENIGKGSIRVSTVVAGDPVIVGEIFVHQKL